MMTAAFMIGLTTQDLKNHFANELRVPFDLIKMTLNGDYTLFSTVIYFSICTNCTNWCRAEI